MVSDYSLLPYLPAIKVFSFLGPKDKLTCSRVCKNWRRLVFSPQLWKEVYPNEWSEGNWDIRNHLPGESCEEYDVYSLALGLSFVNKQVDFLAPDEYKFFKGFRKYLLPHIGEGIQKCVLSKSMVVTDSAINTVLLSCPNLVWLDVSYTEIGKNAFNGVWNYDACRRLQTLDLSCCNKLTEDTMYNLAKCLTPDVEEKSGNSSEKVTVLIPSVEDELAIVDRGYLFPPKYKDHNEIKYLRNGAELLYPLSSIKRHNRYGFVKVSCSKNRKGQFAGLRFLNLAGVVTLTNNCLKPLVQNKHILSKLDFLDVSGNDGISCYELFEFFSLCPSLQPNNLEYCLLLKDGPFIVKDGNGLSIIRRHARPCCLRMEQWL